MDLDLHTIQRAGDRHRPVLACIVHDNHEIDDAMRHYLVVSLAQGARRIIGGHHHDNFLAV